MATTECKVNEVTITQGADKTFFINLTVSEDGQPAKAFKLEADPTSIQVRFPTDSDVLRLEKGPKVVVDDADGGRLKIIMPETDTEQLKATEELQDIEVKVVQEIPAAETTTIFLFPGVLTVNAQRFPE